MNTKTKPVGAVFNGEYCSTAEGIKRFAQSLGGSGRLDTKSFDKIWIGEPNNQVWIECDLAGHSWRKKHRRVTNDANGRAIQEHDRQLAKDNQARRLGNDFRAYSNALKDAARQGLDYRSAQRQVLEQIVPRFRRRRRKEFLFALDLFDDEWCEAYESELKRGLQSPP